MQCILSHAIRLWQCELFVISCTLWNNWSVDAVINYNTIISLTDSPPHSLYPWPHGEGNWAGHLALVEHFLLKYPCTVYLVQSRFSSTVDVVTLFLGLLKLQQLTNPSNIVSQIGFCSHCYSNKQKPLGK